MKNLEEFLKKIGVEKKVIEKLQSEDEVNIDEFAEGYRSQIKTAVASDPSVLEAIKKEVNGEVLSKVEHKLKKTFGLDPTEMSGKKFDEIVNLAYEKAAAMNQSTGDEWQTKYMELSKEHKKIVEEVLPAKEQEKSEFIKSFQINSLQMAKLAAKKLAVSQKLAIAGIQDTLKEMKIKLELNEDGDQIIPKTKDGLNVLAKDGTKVISYDELLDDILGSDHLNIIQQSNGSPDNNQPMRGVQFQKGSDNTKFNLPGMSAARENAERMKNIRTFGK